jgi:hypothetical protein
LLPVAQRIAATKTATITGTTKNGEAMFIVQAPYCSQSTKDEKAVEGTLLEPMKAGKPDASKSGLFLRRRAISGRFAGKGWPKAA